MQQQVNRIRRDAWAIVADPDDETLDWYARAVGRMRSLPIDDPLGWRFQGAIHGYARFLDPFADASDPMPSQGDQDAFWNRCQHNSWFFLPWHRMYLHHFERIVAFHVVELGGPEDWALPYWNYSTDEASRILPTPFQSETLPDGSPNPLHTPARVDAANAGGAFMDEIDVGLECLFTVPFSAPASSGSPSFGGPRTGFNHGGGPIGDLELTPHAQVHVRVSGWMGAFETAALDPIFWLHHANIDRLWDVWLEREDAHENPSEPFWHAGVGFRFHTADGDVQEMTCAEVLDTRQPPLEYEYEDTSDPFAGEIEAGMEAAGPGPTDRTPEMVGATEAPFQLEGATMRTKLPTPAAPSAALEGVAAPDAEHQQVFLQLENLTSDAAARSYDVYVGLPEGADPKDFPDRRVARLPMFGVREASDAKGPHAGAGLTYSIDITRVVRALREKGEWSPDELSVSFMGVGEAMESSVRVGRMSLYVA